MRRIVMAARYSGRGRPGQERRPPQRAAFQAAVV